jgi:predicted nucleic acid-binding Zn ribbon protein
MIKKSNSQSLGDAIREMLREYNLEAKHHEIDAVGLWPEIVGDMINRHTRNIYIKSGKLFVKIDSPALKNELLYARNKIKEAINKRAGKEVISDVIFT